MPTHFGFAKFERGHGTRSAAVDTTRITKGGGLPGSIENTTVDQHVLILTVIGDEDAVFDFVHTKARRDDCGREGY